MKLSSIKPIGISQSIKKQSSLMSKTFKTIETEKNDKFFDLSELKINKLLFGTTNISKKVKTAITYKLAGIIFGSTAFIICIIAAIIFFIF